MYPENVFVERVKRMFLQAGNW